MKSYSLKASDIKRQWYVLDASEAPLGRLATVAASLLIGKRKAELTPHIDGGDYVVVINADKLITTGNKAAAKLYNRHSGFPGGLRQTSLKDVATKDSSEIIRHAVRGMLPPNKLRPGRLKRLKVYRESEHQHHGQTPEKIALRAGDS